MSTMKRPTLQLLKQGKIVATTPVMGGTFIPKCLAECPELTPIQLVISDSAFAFVLTQLPKGSKQSFQLNYSDGSYVLLTGIPYFSGLKFWIFASSLTQVEIHKVGE